MYRGLGFYLYDHYSLLSTFASTSITLRRCTH